MEEDAMIYSRCTCGPAVSKMIKNGNLTAPTSLIRFMKLTFEARVIKNAAILGPFIWQKYTCVILHRLLLICIHNAAFPDFALDVSTEVEVGISCDDGLWFHCIACIWWERNTSNAAPRSLSLFSTATRYPAFSRLSILSFESAIMPKNPKWALNKVLELVETLRRKSPCMRKYCSSASSHSSSDMLCGSSSLRARGQCSVQPLRQSGKMPRPAPMDSDVEDGSPTTASKEFEAVCFNWSWWVFDGVWVSGFCLLPAAAAISLTTFWCLLFKASARTNKRSRAVSMS